MLFDVLTLAKDRLKHIRKSRIDLRTFMLREQIVKEKKKKLEEFEQVYKRI